MAPPENLENMNDEIEAAKRLEMMQKREEYKALKTKVYTKKLIDTSYLDDKTLFKASMDNINDLAYVTAKEMSKNKESIVSLRELSTKHLEKIAEIKKDVDRTEKSILKFENDTLKTFNQWKDNCSEKLRENWEKQDIFETRLNNVVGETTTWELKQTETVNRLKAQEEEIKILKETLNNRDRSENMEIRRMRELLVKAGLLVEIEGEISEEEEEAVNNRLMGVQELIENTNTNIGELEERLKIIENKTSDENEEIQENSGTKELEEKIKSLETRLQNLGNINELENRLRILENRQEPENFNRQINLVKEKELTAKMIRDNGIEYNEKNHMHPTRFTKLFKDFVKNYNTSEQEKANLMRQSIKWEKALNWRSNSNVYIEYDEFEYEFLKQFWDKQKRNEVWKMFEELDLEKTVTTAREFITEMRIWITTIGDMDMKQIPEVCSVLESKIPDWWQSKIQWNSIATPYDVLNSLEEHMLKYEDDPRILDIYGKNKKENQRVIMGVGNFNNKTSESNSNQSRPSMQNSNENPNENPYGKNTTDSPSRGNFSNYRGRGKRTFGNGNYRNVDRAFNNYGTRYDRGSSNFNNKPFRNTSDYSRRTFSNNTNNVRDNIFRTPAPASRPGNTNGVQNSTQKVNMISTSKNADGSGPSSSSQ